MNAKVVSQRCKTRETVIMKGHTSVDRVWQNPVNISKNNTDSLCHRGPCQYLVRTTHFILAPWGCRFYPVPSPNGGNNDSLNEIKCLSVFALAATHFTLPLHSNLHPFISIIRTRSLFPWLQPVGWRERERESRVSSRTCVALCSPHKGKSSF